MSGARLWGIVLAGGEGVRLRALSRRICGDERPKQYGTLLGQTLDRVGREQAWALHQAYALIPNASFARAILEPCPSSLAVAALPNLRWSDLGNRGRVFAALFGVRSQPAWALASDLPAS